MTYNPNWHGFAQQSNFVEVAPSGAGGYPTQHTAAGAVSNKKFAQVIYNIAPEPPPLIPSQIPASSLTITEVYVDGDDSYICEALIGSALTDLAWRITKISQNITTGANSRYANGGSAILAATSLAIVKTYTYA